MIAVNLRSFFLTCKYAVPIMMKQKSGRIINIASQIAQKGGTDHCHYAAAKAGVIGMTKSLAWDLGQYGITVNSIAPGPINTQMMERIRRTEKRENEGFSHTTFWGDRRGGTFRYIFSQFT